MISYGHACIYVVLADQVSLHNKGGGGRRGTQLASSYGLNWCMYFSTSDIYRSPVMHGNKHNYIELYIHAFISRLYFYNT